MTTTIIPPALSEAMKRVIFHVFHDDEWAASDICALPATFSGRRLFYTMHGLKPLLFTYYDNHRPEKIAKDVAILKALNDYSVAPYLFHVQNISDQQALILTDFKVGRTISFVEGAKHCMRMVEQLKHIHALSISPALDAYSIFAQIEDFTKPVIDVLPQMAARDILIRRIKDFTLTHAVSKTLVHNDLHLGNIIIDDNGTTHFIDWEYAGIGDPLGDLAIFTINLALPQNKALALLDHYYAPHRPSRTNVAHFLLLRLCALYRVGLYYLSTRSKDAARTLLAHRNIPSFDSLAKGIGNETMSLIVPEAIDELIRAAIGVFTRERDEVEHLLELRKNF